MLVKELVEYLNRMDENATVKLGVKTFVVDDVVPTYASVKSIEFDSENVILKGDDELVEWD